MYKKLFGTSFLFICFAMLATAAKPAQKKSYYHVQGTELLAPDGKPFLMKGINLGNWLNPEGYMFLFDKTSSYRLIDELLKEVVGEDATNAFWQRYLRTYITREDIAYIRHTGMNSVRIPFHYKLFTHTDYMGSSDPERGFQLLDSVIGWCKREGLSVVLDMHDAPGGQTGDNIDDSYGYPWLFENAHNRALCASIWQKIAKHYANEPAVIGYDLLNEPIAHYFANKDTLNKMLEPLYMELTAAIRKVDKNHIVILGGAQWDGNVHVFTQPKFDAQLMYTVHRYWCDTLKSNIQDFLDFREHMQRPIYMGETGENTDQWVAAFRKLLDSEHIGWHFWPYKKMPQNSCIVTVAKPADWDLLVAYSKKDRSHLGAVRDNCPDRKRVLAALDELLDNVRFSRCTKNTSYISALGLQP